MPTPTKIPESKPGAVEYPPNAVHWDITYRQQTRDHVMTARILSTEAALPERILRHLGDVKILSTKETPKKALKAAKGT